ncbi:MAG: carboxypeptidase-like regulatory domain-containing protein [Gemmatimonadales bacterium]
MRFTSAVLALAVSASAAAAQTRGATVTGTIRAESGGTLEGASVEILGTGFKATTQASGGYRFEQVPRGRYWVLVRRIGYSPARVSVTLADGDDRRLPFELERLPTKLSELTVLAESGMSRPRFQDFQIRSHSAFGTFLTRDDLANYAGDLVSVAQRFLPGRTRLTLEQRIGAGGGLLLRRGGYYLADDGSVFLVGRTSSLATRDCPPAVSVNGSTPMPGLSIADFDLDQVEALEIYRRGNWVPTEFAYQDVTGCGPVVVWLR